MGKYKAIDIARWFIHKNLEDIHNEEDERFNAEIPRQAIEKNLIL